MKLSMSSGKFAHMLKAHPTWEGPLEAILGIVSATPKGRPLDPFVIAQRTGLGAKEVVALLQVLVREKLGRLLLRVVDERGLEIGRYDNVQEIPSVVENEFGDETRVTPENVEVVFVPGER